jgi:hypothetical protein
MEQMMQEIQKRADAVLKSPQGWDPVALRKALVIINYIAKEEVRKCK